MENNVILRLIKLLKERKQLNPFQEELLVAGTCHRVTFAVSALHLLLYDLSMLPSTTKRRCDSSQPTLSFCGKPFHII